MKNDAQKGYRKKFQHKNPRVKGKYTKRGYSSE